MRRSRVVIGWSRGALNSPGARVSIQFFRTIFMTEHESAWLAHHAGSDPMESLPSMRPFDGQGWINAYRII